jgi:hypothetical protein
MYLTKMRQQILFVEGWNNICQILTPWAVARLSPMAHNYNKGYPTKVPEKVLLSNRGQRANVAFFI